MTSASLAVERSADASLVNGHWRFVSCLGAGGMGSVYMARYLGGCEVAVKLVKHMEDDANGRELEDRFVRECRILMGLRHPSIVTAFTHGRIRGTHQRFLVMEYVGGQTLAEHRASLGRPLTPAECTQLLMPIADALSYCHANRIFHRDLSPKNILVIDGPEGALHSKLVDFGASWRDEEEKLTQGVIFGNIDFQPIERFQRETQALDPTHVGFEVDLFGLAAIAYYLTGGMGEKGALLDIHQKVGAEPLVVAGAPEWADLLERAISRERSEHFRDMFAFQRAMRKFHPSDRERERRGNHAFWLTEGVTSTEQTNPVAIAEGGQMPTTPRTAPSPFQAILRLSPRWQKLLFGLLVLFAFLMGLAAG